MNANRHIEQDELALFAMQLLDPEEADTVLLHLSHCEPCRRELAAVQGDLAVFALTAELHSPPALARERLLTQLRRERKAVRPEAERPTETGLGRQMRAEDRDSRDSREDRGHRDRGEERRPIIAGEGRWRKPEAAARRSGMGHVLARVLPWGGWAVAAGMAVLAGNLLHQRDALRGALLSETGEVQRQQADAATARDVLETLTDRNAVRVTLTQSRETPIPLGRASYLPDKGSLVFAASNMAPLGPYKTYELWLIPADGRDPMPAGTFVPDARGNASVILPSLPKGVAAKAFGITIEDEGGSPTPTMPIVMAGT